MESGPKQQKITSSITEWATKERPEESGGQALGIRLLHGLWYQWTSLKVLASNISKRTSSNRRDQSKTSDIMERAGLQVSLG